MKWWKNTNKRVWIHLFVNFEWTTGRPLMSIAKMKFQQIIKLIPKCTINKMVFEFFFLNPLFQMHARKHTSRSRMPFEPKDRVVWHKWVVNSATYSLLLSIWKMCRRISHIQSVTMTKKKWNEWMNWRHLPWLHININYRWAHNPSRNR